MDAEKLRQQFADLRSKLVAGETVVERGITIFPCPEGYGYFVKARGLTQHRADVDVAIRVFIAEVQLLS